VTTSLLGYGRTAERRTASDISISHETDILESIVRRAGGRVHLVGPSFGGLVALTVALRNRAPLASLSIVEAPAAEVLRERGDHEHYRSFRRMTSAYFADFESGNKEAIATMIDFCGGGGGGACAFAAWPPRVRAYAVETTPVNILNWASAYGLTLPVAALQIPVLVIGGGASHPAAQRANTLISQDLRGAELVTVEDAAHFMIATRANQVGGRIAEHVHRAGER
jgi:pimeloyl-ACP methyl ester carboxylesterase